MSRPVFLAAAHPAAASETVLIEIDQAKLVRFDEPASTIILGNPSIADAAVQSGSLLVITGKNFGGTNLIVLDDAGNTIDERILQVGAPNTGRLTMHKGAVRLTYNCAPQCQPTLSMGDADERFQALNSQLQNRLGVATDQSGDN